MSEKKVILVGATGDLGQRVAAALVQKKASVRARFSRALSKSDYQSDYQSDVDF